MRTQLECEGVGPSRTNTWNQPGGATNAFGGAVIVHLLPAQWNSGKSVRIPMALPADHDPLSERDGDRRKEEEEMR